MDVIRSLVSKICSFLQESRQHKIEWSYTWDELTIPPKVVPKGVLITTCEKKKKLFGSSDTTKTVLIDNPAIKEEICQKIESLRGA